MFPEQGGGAQAPPPPQLRHCVVSFTTQVDNAAVCHATCAHTAIVPEIPPSAIVSRAKGTDKIDLGDVLLKPEMLFTERRGLIVAHSQCRQKNTGSTIESLPHSGDHTQE